MKKLLSVLLSVTLVFSLCACGAKETAATTEKGETATEAGKTAREPIAKEDLKIGVIHISDPAAVIVSSIVSGIAIE